MQIEKVYRCWIMSLQKVLELKQTYTIYLNIILYIFMNLTGINYLSRFLYTP